MKKDKWLSVVMLVLLGTLFWGCGAPGQAYLKYWWSGDLQYFYDSNPSTPAIIYSDVYFPTGSGSFYLEYTAWDGTSWWMTYTIDDPPMGFFGPGTNWYYEIDLFSFGPDFYFWETSSYSVTVESEKKSIQIRSGRLD